MAALPQYAVNMKNGGLLLKEVDEIKTESGFHWKMERWYRSRSLYRGFFGQGWCSTLDEKLILKTKGEIQLSTCQSPHPLVFKLNHQASRYIAQNNPEDQIQISFGLYTYTSKNQKRAKFDFKGELRSLYSGDLEIQIKRNQRKLIEALVISSDVQLNIKWHPILDQIENISSGGKELNYKYNGFLLIKKNADTYSYDDLDNLQIRKSGLNLLKIDYDKQEDRVRRIHADCNETYSFQKARSQMSVQCSKMPLQSKVFDHTRVAELQN